MDTHRNMALEFGCIDPSHAANLQPWFDGYMLVALEFIVPSAQRGEQFRHALKRMGFDRSGLFKSLKETQWTVAVDVFIKAKAELLELSWQLSKCAETYGGRVRAIQTGLTVKVGILADTANDNEQANAIYFEHFGQLNALLDGKGIGKHCEPATCEVWQGRLHGYSGLQHLRRVAAYIEYEEVLPQPCTDTDRIDSVLVKHLLDISGDVKALAKHFGVNPKMAFKFPHLVSHADTCGYYVPIDFSMPIYPDDLISIGGAIGSSQRLQNECQELKTILQIPDGFWSQSPEVLKAIETRGGGEAHWEKYAIESHRAWCCLKLVKHH